MDADWDTKWIFIEATTIVVDQSEAMHCENAGSKEHQADGGGENGRKLTEAKWKSKCAIALTHLCHC